MCVQWRFCYSFCSFLANFDVIEMNRYDYLVALGAFSAGLAAGRYIWAETSVRKDLQAIEKELINKCAAEKRNMSSSLLGSAVSGKCSLNPANADECAGEETELAEVLFFPDHGYTCKEFTSNGGCKTENCQFLHHETGLGYLFLRILF